LKIRTVQIPVAFIGGAPGRMGNVGDRIESAKKYRRKGTAGGADAKDRLRLP